METGTTAVTVGHEPGKGRTVLAARPLEEGETVVEGTVTGTSAVQTRMSFQKDWDLHIDLDEPAQLINHSCAPNTGIVDNARGGYDFVALRPIAPGEEITWDYDTTEWEITSFADCLCGADECRGRPRGHRHHPAAPGVPTAAYLGSGRLHPVELPPDHPGFADRAYRRRRAAIAAAAEAHRPGRPAPHVSYTEEEEATWRTALTRLGDLHTHLAAPEFLDAARALDLPADRIPQLDEVSVRLTALTGFRLEPAPGLVPLRRFYGSLADSCFRATQYLRHTARPLYSPEPDVLHELVGHANALAHPRFAALYRLAGQAAARMESGQGLDLVSKVFWFTLESGVLAAPDGPRAYGASILSSSGELGQFRGAEIRRLDIDSVARAEYDITAYQSVLFQADSMDHLEDTAGAFWADCDDDTVARLCAVSA
ncbi:phenylalanine 4-monooxygenase [Streptomyces sp. NBC_00091]|uniref:phenylalanine 4-monooxygenase n=1 Tax=Streptomyces sp. NBC_00091 TaxID=2975648 RepID=UPI00225306FB|nr:phenylalanine 4-monooxygenase [Streptomyces sp. NBC_00091]MCX5380996.1 phenylalanine 4-monooxygenase [Streptomyces sp. NBC_00091]